MPATLSLKQSVLPTTIIRSSRLNDTLGVDVVLATETFQHTGSFKFRAAYNLVSKVPQGFLITASSGNFGQALAYACKLLGKQCTVVMPANSAKIKVNAVREHGGEVDLVDTLVKNRAERVAELAAEHPEAYVASAYDDPLVIEGNASLGEELAALELGARVFVCPIGGGGLASGLVRGLRRSGLQDPVYAAEPLLANDAARSFREGRIITNEQEPQTIADGSRTLSLGALNWEILRESLAGVIEVPEDAITRALRILFERANLKVEPTGALAVGALLAEPSKFAGQEVCCVISGGNVDPAIYQRFLTP